MTANKKSRTIDEQIALLKTRGLTIKDEQKTAFYLSSISYYRLKGYWWDMQTDFINHKFATGSNFDEVIARYHFDCHLRLILFSAIEFIEITLRTKMIYHLSQAYGGLWYLNETLFADKEKHKANISNLQDEFARSGEIFAKAFREKHPSEKPKNEMWESSVKPDAWLIFEVTTFGTLSKIYKNLDHVLPEKSIIAKEFGLNLHSELSSWLEAITYLRNIVAHHSRVWSKNMAKRPTLPKNPRNQWLQNSLTPVQEKKPFLLITSMLYLCNAINPNHEIKNKLLTLFKNNPSIPIYKMGFLNNWQNEALWK